MVHRPILTARQRNDLMVLPTDESSMLIHYLLSNEDISLIKQKRDAHNRLGLLYNYGPCAIQDVT